MKWIGKRVRELRLARGLTQGAIGTPRTYIVRLENGYLTPGIRKLERIADALGIGLWRFFVSDSEHQALCMLEDPFVLAVKLFVHDLNEQDREYILKVVAAAPKYNLTVQGLRGS